MIGNLIIGQAHRVVNKIELNEQVRDTSKILDNPSRLSLWYNDR
ncbi:hypothetical protein HMPREF9555_01378 [Selenomonas artemidis F0399]|uniref:Uncharacterized protein n=1 Tax=Selenomonas artemidis F0399 TaxID=749551 RepID=E7N306_9FIRM|nr:hypothetical protein HMPREF9555_01378 [Selenomonas artemidis F0399]